MADTKSLIESTVRRFQDEVPALANLKLAFGLELRGRGDVQAFSVEVPGPAVSRGVPDHARVTVRMPRATFNELAEYVIWALLQLPAVDVDVDVDTIIVRCFGAMI